MDEDVEAAEPIERCVDDLIDSVARADVGLDEPFGGGWRGGWRARWRSRLRRRE